MVVLRSSYASARASHLSSARRSTLGLLLLLLLVHVAPFSTAWKFRWGRGRRGSSEAAGVLSGAPHDDKNGGDPTNQDQNLHTAQQQQPQPAPGDPLSQGGRKPFFSWDVASAAAEIAEDTMEDAVGLFREVVDHLKPPPALQNALVQAFAKFRAALLYQPPVGFVATVVVSRLLLTGRIFRLKAVKDSSVEDELFDPTKIQEQARSRSWILDGDDNAYTAFGGVERFRRRLCLAAVNGLLLQQQQYQQHIQHQQQDGATNAGSATAAAPPQTPPPPLNDSQQELVEAAAQALSITFQPSGSRRRLVHEMVDPVSKLEAGVLLATTEDDAGAARTKRGTTSKQQPRTGAPTPANVEDPCSISSHQVDQLLQVAALTSQVQATDALLRVCRNGILQTAYRLARTVEHWERRVQQSRYFGRWMQWLVQQSMESERLQLSLAVAAYNAEVTRLGQVTAVLMERPPELPEQAMIEALKATEERSLCPKPPAVAPATIFPAPAAKKKGKAHTPRRPKEFLSWLRSAPVTKKEDKVTALQRPKGWLSRWKTWPLWSKYSLRWKADRKGILSIRRFDASDSYVDVPSAVSALLKNYTTTTNDPSGDDWMRQARDWTTTARGVVCQVVQGCLQGSTHKSLTKSCSEADFRMLRDQWCSVGSPKPAAASSSSSSSDVPAHPDAGAVGSQWRSLVKYVDQTPSWRRIGEGQKIRLRDAFRFVNWYKNWDFFGIPSSLLMIYGSTIVHERFVKVYWSTVSKEVADIAVKAGEIFKARAWGPMKEIYDDIMNKSPSMMSALGLDVEETSLDHMLRDLGFGDGTSATRQEALKLATEQYEKDLSSGLFSNFLKGRLVRLLLVQVQQLKVGLLSALDTIDVLIQGNRIHFKVLAAIPAVVIATFGTRYLARVLYNLRAKDIRPVTVVHAEMGQYLTKIENLLLLSEQVDLSEEIDEVIQTRQRPEKQANHSGPGHWATALQPAELGELILNMHRYLILLDFSSPPFPSRNCDQIHSSLQQFLGTGGTLKRLDSDRQILWLGRIKQKHQDLLKTI